MQCPLGYPSHSSATLAYTRHGEMFMQSSQTKRSCEVWVCTVLDLLVTGKLSGLIVALFASFIDIQVYFSNCRFSGFFNSLPCLFLQTISQRCLLAISPAEWHFPAPSTFSAPMPIHSLPSFLVLLCTYRTSPNAVHQSSVYSHLLIISEHTSTSGSPWEFLSWLFTIKISLSTEGRAPKGLNCFKTEKEPRINPFRVHV